MAAHLSQQLVGQMGRAGLEEGTGLAECCHNSTTVLKQRGRAHCEMDTASSHGSSEFQNAALRNKCNSEESKKFSSVQQNHQLQHHYQPVNPGVSGSEVQTIQGRQGCYILTSAAKHQPDADPKQLHCALLY